MHDNIISLQPRDPVLELIAQEEGLRAMWASYFEQAEEAWLALGQSERVRLQDVPHAQLPDPIGQLFREAEHYEREAAKVEAEILRTRATTIAGVIALLEHDHIDADEIAVASLREIERNERQKSA
jgi:hypothetical protein